MSPRESSIEPGDPDASRIFLAAASAALPDGGAAAAWGEGVEWVYYGDDPEAQRRWRRRLGRPPRDPGPRLDRIADRLRAPALRLRARVAARNDPLALHASQAFDLNCMASPLFLELCRLELTRELAQEHDSLLVVTEDPALHRALVRNGARLNAGLRELGRAPWAGRGRLWRRVRLAARRAASVLKAVYNSVVCLAAGRRAGRRREETPWDGGGREVTILRSWGNPDSFVRGEYRERYLPGLAEELEGRGVRTAVWLSVPTTRLADQLGVLRGAAGTGSCFTPWELLRWEDLVWALRAWWRQRDVDPGPGAWNGWRIGDLLDAEVDRFLLRGGGYRFLLEHRAWRRLREAGIEVERLIHTFENMFHEKPLVLGLRETYPRASAVGFQHSTPYPNQLVMYRHEGAEWGPGMPDVVVTSGRIFADQLREQGYPEERLREGPALRFRTPPRGDRGDEDRDGLLVALPLALPEARYLWDTFLAALELAGKGWKVTLKPHPMMASSVLQDMTREGEGRVESLEVAEGDFGPLVARAECLVATASSVLLDGVLAGTPVVRVKRADRLNFDPLDWIEEVGPISFEAYSGEEVAAALHRIREEGGELIRRGGEVSRAVRRGIFSAANDLSPFVTRTTA